MPRDRPYYWILHPDHNVEPVPDLMTWARWFEKNNRGVASDNWMAKGDEIRVSTVFLGIDHNIIGWGPALLFETMIFGGPNDGDQERYATWDEAVQGHEKFVKREKGDKA